MDNFCTKCGAQMPQGSGFCTNCGAPMTRNTMLQQAPSQYAQQVPQQAPSQYSQQVPQQAPSQYSQQVPSQFDQQMPPQMLQQDSPDKKGIDFKKPLFSIGKLKVDLTKLIIAVGGLLLVIILLVVLLGGGRTPESVVDDVMEAQFEDFNAYAVVDYVHEDAIYAKAERKDMTVDEYIADLQEEYTTTENMIQIHELDWKILSVKKAGIDEFEDYQEEYKEYNHELVVEDVQIVKVLAHVRLSSVFEPDEIEENEDTNEIAVIKIDGDWYIDIDYIY